jgi:hypothetical protein
VIGSNASELKQQCRDPERLKECEEDELQYQGKECWEKQLTASDDSRGKRRKKASEHEYK